MEWLEQNRECFLSGAGIFIISSIVAFGSVLVTLWWKSRSEKKKIKRLKILLGTTRFSVPSAHRNNKIATEHIKISYKNNEYENLCVYTAQINNIGLPAIESQRLHLIIPVEAKVIKIIENKSLESINVTHEEIDSPDKKEVIYRLERLERNDIYTISYLLDMEEGFDVRCDLRGVDNIEYSYKEDIDTSEINHLVLYVATFVFADIVPFFGGLLQALIIIVASPIIIELIRKYSQSKDSSDNVLNISGGIKVDESGEIYINQKAM